LSVIIANSLSKADECQWYCLTYVVDATLGTALNILLLKLFEMQVKRCPTCTSMDFGEYGNPPQLNVWFKQLFVWLTIVVIAKVVTLYLLYQLIVPLNEILSDIFAVFHDKPELELVLVMIIIPTILNTLQFWVTDTYLKNHADDAAGGGGSGGGRRAGPASGMGSYGNLGLGVGVAGSDSPLSDGDLDECLIDGDTQVCIGVVGTYLPIPAYACADEQTLILHFICVFVYASGVEATLRSRVQCAC
jgi:hypothetical protein